MDPTIVGLVVFTIIVLVVIWVFRHRIKIAIKGRTGRRPSDFKAGTVGRILRRLTFQRLAADT